MIMNDESIKSLKEQGNKYFKEQNFIAAQRSYSDALRLLGETSTGDSDSVIALLSNRAACYLKDCMYQECIKDCCRILDQDARYIKALYRRATAYYELSNFNESISDLRRLLSIDPKNAPGLNLMRSVNAQVILLKNSDSESRKVIKRIQCKDIAIVDGLKYLIGLCGDDKGHAVDFGTSGGIELINDLLSKNTGSMSIKQLGSDSSRTPKEPLVAIDESELGLKLLSALCMHQAFVSQYINFSPDLTTPDRHRISFSSVAKLSGHPSHKVALCSLQLLVLILRFTPLYGTEFSEQQESATFAGVCSPSNLFLCIEVGKSLIAGINDALNVQTCFEVKTAALDLLAAFVSEENNYVGSNAASKEFDSRLESMEDRKKRQMRNGYLKCRSEMHSKIVLGKATVATLLTLMDCSMPLVRQRASTCFGRIFQAISDENLIKETLLPYLTLDNEATDISPCDAEVGVIDVTDLPPIESCRCRAAIETSLFMAKPELGVWALGLRGGVTQLTMLLSLDDSLCQELSSEVLCLAANTDEGAALLAPTISSGILHNLSQSTNFNVRAAVASTIVKLSLKAKALSENSPELSQILNTVSLVISHAANAITNSSNSCKSTTQQSSTSIESGDKVSSKQLAGKQFFASQLEQDSGRKLLSLERAVEILAAIIGKNYIKEEVLYGSSRVVAIVPALLSLSDSLDVRSTAVYGIAHVLASITVTNKELRMRALAEKDISPEQYEQMQKLQRIHTKDEEGNVIEDTNEDAEDESDTMLLCKQRIKHLVSLNSIPILLRLLSQGSVQTREYAARALAQICVEESIRGIAIQQGLLKVCSFESNNPEQKKQSRMLSSHCIAKCLVTTDPNLLPEHTRAACMRALLQLCRESDATNLQQFETLLSITNLLSCGEETHIGFVHDKGIQTVHYLMFSDHCMVRRAATEVFCNMALNEDLLKILRVPDKVRLWLGLCEDWNNDIDVKESLATSRAAAGTLAMASTDFDVCIALVTETCAETIIKLLESEMSDLIHRALVIISNLCNAGGKGPATHLVERGVIPHIGIVSKLGDSNLITLAKETAADITNAMSLAEAIQS